MYYIINLTENKVVSKNKSRPRANWILTNSYAPDPDNKYSIMSEEEAYDYWHEREEETGVFYEGLGTSENKKHDIFNDWIEGN